MCCSAARLFAALVTFTIGTLVAIPFLNQPTKVSQTPLIEVSNTHICTSLKVEKSTSPSCLELLDEELDYEKSLEPIIQKWLAGKLLEKHERIELSPCLGNYDSANVELIDINSDGKKELFIQAFCAAVGNCGLDLYIKQGRSYKSILKTDMVSYIEVKKTKTNGYYDLDLKTHSSATDSNHRLYKFDGKEYKKVRCWSESYQQYDKKTERFRDLKRPKIYPGKCTAGNDF